MPHRPDEQLVFQIECHGHAISLPLGQVEIGRAASCFITISDPSVSRRHLRVVVTDAGVHVTDLGSANGTRINGERLVGSRRLDDGDELLLGTQQLRLRLAEPTSWDEKTPVRAPTLPGLGALPDRPVSTLQRCCPTCRAAIRFDAARCLDCNARLPVAASSSKTDPTRPSVRRAHTRIAVSIPVHYTSDNMVLDGTVRDMSDGGLFIESPRVDRLNTFCRLVLQPEHGAELVLHGWVRNLVTDEPHRGMGIEFAGIEASDEQRLRLIR